MRVAPIFIAIVSSLFLVNCARSPDALTQRRIAGVEQGLLSDYSDPPWKRMELLERMQHYRVPGVSIAVINAIIAIARGSKIFFISITSFFLKNI